MVQKRLADKKIEIELTEGAKELMAEEGFDLVYGARPLKRVIQRDILNPLATGSCPARSRKVRAWWWTGATETSSFAHRAMRPPKHIDRGQPSPPFDTVSG